MKRLRNFLRRWLSVEQNEKDIECSNSKINQALEQTKTNRGLVRGLQQQVTGIKNKIKKH